VCGNADAAVIVYRGFFRRLELCRTGRAKISIRRGLTDSITILRYLEGSRSRPRALSTSVNTSVALIENPQLLEEWSLWHLRQGSEVVKRWLPSIHERPMQESSTPEVVEGPLKDA
jgi:hypothetical protein